MSLDDKSTSTWAFEFPWALTYFINIAENWQRYFGLGVSGTIFWKSKTALSSHTLLFFFHWTWCSSGIYPDLCLSQADVSELLHNSHRINLGLCFLWVKQSSLDEFLLFLITSGSYTPKPLFTSFGARIKAWVPELELWRGRRRKAGPNRSMWRAARSNTQSDQAQITTGCKKGEMEGVLSRK